MLPTHHHTMQINRRNSTRNLPTNNNLYQHLPLHERLQLTMTMMLMPLSRVARNGRHKVPRLWTGKSHLKVAP